MKLKIVLEFDTYNYHFSNEILLKKFRTKYMINVYDFQFNYIIVYRR